MLQHSFHPSGCLRVAAAALVLSTLLSSGCGGGGNTASTAPDPIAVATTALPAAQAGTPYSFTLQASGGTAPYHWAVAGGTLPQGLLLNTSSGALTGTPLAAAAGIVSLTFSVTDSGTPAQRATAALTLTINASTLTITTTSLPNGQVGVAYSATLSASGGTTPYTWTLTAGALPAGLSLSAAGVISGNPTATLKATPLTFKVTDSGSASQSQTVNLTLTVSPHTITVTISPKTAALTITQTISASATTNDLAGVTWKVTPAGGSISPAASSSGANVIVTAPGTAGVYTLTASSVTDHTSASITVAVTDLAGVYTYHNDLARDGANTQEYALTTANVNTTSFGKLFSCPVDGAVYAQPLWVANLTVAGVKHNALFAATQHDSLYAFDADTGTQLWKVNLIDTAHGATGGEMTVPSGPTGYLVGGGSGDITPEVGVTGTPVIDSAASILFVVSKSVDSTRTTFYQRLHAIDLATGNEKLGSPQIIGAQYLGTGDGGTMTTFSARQQNQRAGLALVNGVLYIAWSSHEDAWPWYGWIVAYKYSGLAFSQPAVLNVTPNTGKGGIWMGGGAPSADAAGHLYLITGNGDFDANSSTAPNNDYGDSFLQLTAGLTPRQYFTATDQANENAFDLDFGSGGAAVVLNLPSGSPQHLVVGGGKEGTLYLLDGDAMGGLGDSHARQSFTNGAGDSSGIWGTGAFWGNTLYIVGGQLKAYAFDTTSNLFNPTTPISKSPTTFGFPGASPSVSATGSSNGIVWGLDSGTFCGRNSSGCGPAVLHAYNAASLATELWNSALTGADAAGNAVKFTVPTVANGKVYVGTRGNNTGGAFGSTSVSGEVDVYGLKPN